MEKNLDLFLYSLVAASQGLSHFTDDFRLFAGDLGNDVTDELLHRYFSHYASFIRAKVVRDKRTNKSKGYGFISFKDSQDYIRAMKEMNGKYHLFSFILKVSQ